LTLLYTKVKFLVLNICCRNSFSPADVGMTEPSAIDTAVKRLALALDGLDAAVERRREADHDREQLAQQLQALSVDRSKLAADLDNETALARKLKATNHEIAERLDIAIANIQSILAYDSEKREPVFEKDQEQTNVAGQNYLNNRTR
jgi:uncharacterized protein DUF4164